MLTLRVGGASTITQVPRDNYINSIGLAPHGNALLRLWGRPEAVKAGAFDVLGDAIGPT